MRYLGWFALFLLAFAVGLRWHGHLVVHYNASAAVEDMKQYTNDRQDDFHKWLEKKADDIVKKHK